MSYMTSECAKKDVNDNTIIVYMAIYGGLQIVIFFL